MRTWKTLAAALAMAAAAASPSYADNYATRDEATAMVKKAVTLIKGEGAEKAYPQLNEAGGKFVDRDLYIVVLTMDGTTLVQPVNPKLIGKNLMAVPDVDGKLFVKAMVDKAQTESSFWEELKFVNPVTKKIQPKEMYCERLNETLVCAGVYKS